MVRRLPPLCAEFGISRVTGYKIIERYKDSGLDAFADCSRKPFCQANRLPFQVEQLIVRLKNEFPTWGAPKLRERLRTHYGEIALPTKSTVHSVLDRYGLSSLSVWWLRLGIGIERIKPGNPQQNGRHERMHLTLKQATTKPPAKTLLQQQDKFEDFIHEYNYERPHQALEMKKPAQLYTPSTRQYEGLPDVSYPFHDKTVTVTNCGRICLDGKKIYFSTVFAGHDVGLRQVEDDVWLVSFMD